MLTHFKQSLTLTNKLVRPNCAFRKTTWVLTSCLHSGERRRWHVSNLPYLPPNIFRIRASQVKPRAGRGASDRERLRTNFAGHFPRHSSEVVGRGRRHVCVYDGSFLPKRSPLPFPAQTGTAQRREASSQLVFNRPSWRAENVRVIASGRSFQIKTVDGSVKQSVFTTYIFLLILLSHVKFWNLNYNTLFLICLFIYVWGGGVR